MTRRPSIRGERLYRLLLLLYPRSVRETDGETLLDLFGATRRTWLARHGRTGPGFWFFIARDTVTNAWRERRNPLDSNGRQPSDGGDGMTGGVDDLRYAARRLRRSPGFTLTALTILVAGIGVNSIAFSMVNALLLQSPPFDQPDRVVAVLQDDDSGSPNSTSYPAYLDIARTEGLFSAVSAFQSEEGFLEQGDGLTPLLIEYATASYLEVIGLAPARGRWFGVEHDDPTGPPAAVITHRMWTDRMAADPDVIGRTIRLQGAAVTVVGVGPPEFNGGRGPGAIDLWLSISAMGPTGGRVASLNRREDHPFIVRARLAPGVSFEQASEAMDRLAGDLARAYPELNEGRGMSVLPVDGIAASPRAQAEILPASVLTMSLVLLVLVIGTLNLANLLLVRNAARTRELSVRLALGAARSRVMRVVLAEAMLLSAVGGVGGLAVAWLAAAAARNARLDFALPILIDLRLDARVVWFTLGVSVVTGVVFGLLPAIRATRQSVNATLRDDATSGIGARRRFGLTGGLVAAQVAASILLLAVAAVFVESLSRAQRADPGFAWERTAYVRMSAASLDLDSEALTLFLDGLEERIEALPGVTATARSLALPAAQMGTTTLLLGAGTGGSDRPTEIPWNWVSPEYFDLLDIPLRHGRYFTEDDFDRGDVAIVSESFARTYWGRSDIVGETYRREGEPNVPLEIVGVVGNVTVRSLGEAPSPAIYWPMNFVRPNLNLLVQASDSPAEALRGVREAFREADPRLMIFGAGTMADHLGSTLARQRVAGRLLLALGAVALGLAMLGVYGVVSYAVSRRRREVGIRIALGAGSESVIGLFVRDVAGVVVAGALVGALLSVPLARVVSQWFTNAPASPVATAVIAVLLLGTSLAATAVPAMRAARTDPTDALRQE